MDVIKLILDHEHTPPDLRELNSNIENILRSDDIETEDLLKQINLRDDAINNYLGTLSEESRQLFAKFESITNQTLLEEVKKIQNQVLSDTVSIIRSRKAIKKYK